MEVLSVIGVIILVVVLFVVLGLSGWLLNAIGNIFSFLLNGMRSGCGCIFTIFAILFFLYVAAMLMFG